MDLQFLEKKNTHFFSTRMKIYLKELGHDVWNSVISDYLPPKRIRNSAQNKSKKSNTMERDSILDGLPDDVKEKIGECKFTKELWDKIKYLYLVEEKVEGRLSILKDVSEDEEKLFIGTTDSDEESKVDI